MIGADQSSILSGRQLITSGFLQEGDLLVNTQTGGSWVAGSNCYLLGRRLYSIGDYRVYRLMPTAHELDRKQNESTN